MTPIINEDHIFEYGKHKDVHIKEVLSEAPHYCAWLRSCDKFKDDKYLQETIAKYDDWIVNNYKMKWGKYKGRFINQLDDKYCEWLLNSCDFAKKDFYLMMILRKLNY